MTRHVVTVDSAASRPSANSPSVKALALTPKKLTQGRSGPIAVAKPAISSVVAAPRLGRAGCCGGDPAAGFQPTAAGGGD